MYWEQLKDKNVVAQFIGRERPDKSGNYKCCHPHLDPLPSREGEGGEKGGALWQGDFILW